MASSAYHLIGGAFAFQAAHFAVHPLDRQRACQYLAEALARGVTWAEAKEDIRSYLNEQNCTQQKVREEIDRARPMLEPWLA